MVTLNVFGSPLPHRMIPEVSLILHLGLCVLSDLPRVTQWEPLEPECPLPGRNTPLPLGSHQLAEAFTACQGYLPFPHRPDHNFHLCLDPGVNWGPKPGFQTHIQSLSSPEERLGWMGALTQLDLIVLTLRSPLESWEKPLNSLEEMWASGGFPWALEADRAKMARQDKPRWAGFPASKPRSRAKACPQNYQHFSLSLLHGTARAPHEPT
jgi:hypothetical protein